MTEVSHLNHTETGSVSGFASDSALIAFVEQSIEHARHSGGADLVPVPPKLSALSVAILRAAHQLLDDPLVFEDPLALSILGAAAEESLRSAVPRCEASQLKGYRASLVARGRLAEDEWAQAQQSGVSQYVILGAGLDTFAYRNPDHARCRIFEVDLPDMTQWKRECLRMAGIEEPDALTFVPTDFECDSPAEALRQAGFDQDAPAFFSWLGVAMYLDEETIMDTLRVVGSLATGSGIVFDYAVHPNYLSPRAQQVMEQLDKRMAEQGEPWRTHLDPASLREMLCELGFTDVEEFGPEQTNARYFSGRTDGLRKGSLTRMIRARV
jgi:methyltransferase (TIGR00027 family)